METCPRCGERLEDRADFCFFCRWRRTEEPPALESIPLQMPLRIDPSRDRPGGEPPPPETGPRPQNGASDEEDLALRIEQYRIDLGLEPTPVDVEPRERPAPPEAPRAEPEAPREGEAPPPLAEARSVAHPEPPPPEPETTPSPPDRSSPPPPRPTAPEREPGPTAEPWEDTPPRPEERARRTGIPTWVLVSVVVLAAILAAAVGALLRLRVSPVEQGSVVARAPVGPEGARIPFGDGAVLEIPPGALTRTQEIRIRRIGPDGAASPSPGPAVGVPGATYAFEPTGIRLRVPATVRFPVPEDVDRPAVVVTSGGERRAVPADVLDEMIVVSTRDFRSWTAPETSPLLPSAPSAP